MKTSIFHGFVDFVDRICQWRLVSRAENQRRLVMAATQLFLNDQLVTITAEQSVIKRLNEDDNYLADYVNKAAKMGQFSFLFKDQPIKRIIVRRAATSALKQVWYKKGRPSETDTAAIALLLKLRGADKYESKFKHVFAVRAKIWDEIAVEMRLEGYDVDGPKCSQKFLNLAQGYYKYRTFIESCSCSEQKMYPPEFYSELHRILGGKNRNEGESDEGDEEWLPKTRNKRKKIEASESEEDFFKKYLKKSSEEKEERYREICELMKKRNNLIREKIKQNDKMINLLQKLVNN